MEIQTTTAKNSYFYLSFIVIYYLFYLLLVCGHTKSIEKVETFTFNKVFLSNCWWTVYTSPNKKLKAIISNLEERQSIEVIEMKVISWIIETNLWKYLQIYFATSQSFSSRNNLIATVPASTETFELISPLNYFTFRFNSSQVESDQSLNVTIAVKGVLLQFLVVLSLSNSLVSNLKVYFHV